MRRNSPTKSAVAASKFWKGYALVVTGVLAFVAGNAVAPADATPEPHLSNAKVKLESAVKALNTAKGEFGGHRAQAIDLTRQAIEEVNLALKAPRGDTGGGSAGAPKRLPGGAPPKKVENGPPTKKD